VAKKSSLVLVSGRGYEQLAHEVAELLGIEVLPMKIYDFANGEIYAQISESIRGKDVFVIQSHTDPINKLIMEQLIMIDALKRASAHRVTAVMPSFGYARQDKKHKPREPITARLLCDFYKTAGADRIMTVDLHAPQIQGFFNGPVDHIEAMPLLVRYFKENHDLRNVTIVSPDAGRTKVAEQWSRRLDGCPIAFVHKTRDITTPNKVKTGRVVGDVKGRDCIITDDMIDTGGTIVGAANALKNAGASSISVAATHGIFSAPAVQRLSSASLREVVCTDTIPIPEEKRFKGLTVLSAATLLAPAIRGVFEGQSLGRVMMNNDNNLKFVQYTHLSDDIDIEETEV
jgi:ribose-phosphate pyrophosphokinase